MVKVNQTAHIVNIVLAYLERWGDSHILRGRELHSLLRLAIDSTFSHDCDLFKVFLSYLEVVDYNCWLLNGRGIGSFFGFISAVLGSEMIGRRKNSRASLESSIQHPQLYNNICT